MRISDWSSDVCSSDLVRPVAQTVVRVEVVNPRPALGLPISIAADRGAPIAIERDGVFSAEIDGPAGRVGQFIARQIGVEACAAIRSEEHTSELQSLMRISYAVFCLKKKKKKNKSNER